MASERPHLAIKGTVPDVIDFEEPILRCFVDEEIEGGEFERRLEASLNLRLDCDKEREELQRLPNGNSEQNGFSLAKVSTCQPADAAWAKGLDLNCLPNGTCQGQPGFVAGRTREQMSDRPLNGDCPLDGGLFILV